MSKIMGGVQRDALDAKNREARRLAKERKDELEISLPGWQEPEPKTYRMRRHIERKVSSGHKVTLKLFEE